MTDRGKTVLILGLSTALMFSPLAMNLFWRPIPLFQNLGFGGASIAQPGAWILAALTAMVYVVYTFKAIPMILAKQKEISLFKLLGIFSAVVGGIVEEVVFRRWLMDLLLSRGADLIIQVIVSGLVFGLAHTSWVLARRDLKFTIPAVLSTSGLGMLLALIYLVAGRNLGPCIFAHAAINVVIEPWLMLSSVSGMWNSITNRSQESSRATS